MYPTEHTLNIKDPKVKKIVDKAKKCLEKKVEIPSSPLWNMAKAAKFDSDDDMKYLQEALDYLTCKARGRLSFEENEKEFLRELYEAFWWGGKFKGYPEAAKLANHYVHGKGRKLPINPEVYQQSKIVQATATALKEFILTLKGSGKSYAKIRCDNPVFMASTYAQPLKKMNFRTEGKMKSTGVLEAAQNDHRLHKTDGHFYLEATSIALKNKKIKTLWSIDSLYDFVPFGPDESKNYFTHIPLGNKKLTIYDGLSEYMTKIGAADIFWYRAEWTEIWEY